MVLIMFLVPSDIMVVGPGNVMTSQDYKLRKLVYGIYLPKYLNKAIFSLGKCTVVCICSMHSDEKSLFLGSD